MSTDREKLEQVEQLVGEVKAHQADAPPTGPVIADQRIVGTQKDATLLTLAAHTTIDRCVLLGSLLGQKRGIRVEVPGCTIRGTRIENIWALDDTQCISGDTGTRDLLIEDCTLEASGENIIFGGSDNASDDLTPRNIQLLRCILRKNPAWLGRKDMSCKNLLELKNCKQFTATGCTLEYSWNSGQVGFAIVLSVRNQNNTAPWSTIEDVLIKDCIVRHCAGGVQILGRDDKNPSGLIKRVTFDNLQIEDIDPLKWGRDAKGVPTNGRIFQLTNGSEDVQILNSKFTGQNLNSMFTFGAGSPPLAQPHVRFVVSNAFFDSGMYGIRGDDPDGSGPEQSLTGVKALERYCPGYVWNNVTVRKSANMQPIVWPPGTILV